MLACAIAVALGAGAAAPLEAQSVQQRAPRGFRGLFGGTPAPDPNRTRQDLTLTAAFLGGYDDNLAAAAAGGIGGGGGGSAPQPGQTESGYLAHSQVDVRYYRGHVQRSFAVDGSIYGVSYGDAGAGISTGGALTFNGTTRVRQRDTLQFTQTVNNDPLFALNTLSVVAPVQGTTPLPGTNPTTGILDRRSWSAQSALDYALVTSRNNVVGFGYNFGARRYPEGDDLAGDSDTHRASLDVVRSLNRRVSLRTSYNFGYGTYRDAAGDRPLTEHTISGGPQVQKVFSRFRRLQLSAAVGANYTETLSSVATDRQTIDYWTPYGEAALQFDLSRTWDMNLNYRRGTSVLPEVTTDSFVTDGVTFGIGGVIGSRLVVDANAGFSTGTTAAAAGARARNETITWSSQARWAFNRKIAASVSYDYYKYEFTDTGDLPEGFPPGSSRNAIRVGVTIWLPLIGNYVGERSNGRSDRS